MLHSKGSAGSVSSGLISPKPPAGPGVPGHVVQMGNYGLHLGLDQTPNKIFPWPQTPDSAPAYK